MQKVMKPNEQKRADEVLLNDRVVEYLTDIEADKAQEAEEKRLAEELAAMIELEEEIMLEEYQSKVANMFDEEEFSWDKYAQLENLLNLAKKKREKHERTITKEEIAAYYREMASEEKNTKSQEPTEKYYSDFIAKDNTRAQRRKMQSNLFSIKKFEKEMGIIVNATESSERLCSAIEYYIRNKFSYCSTLDSYDANRYVFFRKINSTLAAKAEKEDLKPIELEAKDTACYYIGVHTDEYCANDRSSSRVTQKFGLQEANQYSK